MSAPPAAKKPRAGGPRLTLQLTFGNTDTMALFKQRMEVLKSALAPCPLKPVDLIAKLFEIADINYLVLSISRVLRNILGGKLSHTSSLHALHNTYYIHVSHACAHFITNRCYAPQLCCSSVALAVQTRAPYTCLLVHF
jgi:hypothetical protein